MNLTAAAYARALRALLPTGPAWIVEQGTVLANLLLGVSEELARIDGRAGAVINESDPRTTFELLADWERVYGLPDPCMGTQPSVGLRRASLIAKLLGGGQTPAYYIALAEALGYAITITEYTETTFDDPFDTPFYDETWAHTWLVTGPDIAVHERVFDDPFDDPYASWSGAELQCVLAETKPAHTTLIFETA